MKKADKESANTVTSRRAFGRLVEVLKVQSPAYNSSRKVVIGSTNAVITGDSKQPQSTPSPDSVLRNKLYPRYTITTTKHTPKLT